MKTACLALCLVASACGDKKREAPAAEPAPAVVHDAAPPPPVGPSAPLWQRAPADAVAGLVIPPNAAGKLAAAWQATQEAAAREPFWAGVAAELAPWLQPLFAHAATPVARFYGADGRPLPEVTGVDAGGAALAGLSQLTGDLELRVDPTRVRGFAAVLERLDQQVIRGTNAWVAALSIDGNRVVVEVDVAGAPVEPWNQALVDPGPNQAIADRQAASQLALTLRLHPAIIAAWAGAVGVDAEELALFTGDLGVFVRGAAPHAIVLVLGVSDPDRARAAVGPLCNSLLRPFGPIEKLADGECQVRLAPPAEAAGGRLGRALLEAVSGRVVHAGVQGDALVVRIGEAAPPAPASAAVATWQLALRTEGFDLLTLVPGLAQALEPQTASALHWLAEHVEGVDLGLRVHGGGIRARLELIVGQPRAGRSP